MNYKIREIEEKEYSVLDTFLYEAIFIPESVSPPSKDIIKSPDLQVYIQNFGKERADIGMIVEINNKIIGAAWARIMDDHGHINDDIPSLAISILKEYRNQGIGTQLLKELLHLLKLRSFSKVSLAVQKENYAVKMYKKLGFKIFDENDQEYIMIADL